MQAISSGKISLSMDTRYAQVVEKAANCQRRKKGTPREPSGAGRVGRRRRDAADMEFSQFCKESAETEWSSILPTWCEY
jgi:hypothetical protein